MKICPAWVRRAPGVPDELACCFEEGHPGAHMDAVDDVMWELTSWRIGEDRPGDTEAQQIAAALANERRAVR